MDKLFTTCAFLIIIFATVKPVNSANCGFNETERWGVKFSDSCYVNQYNLTERQFGCFCKDRHKRNTDGKCVIENECPEEDDCGINETKRLRIKNSDSCFDKQIPTTDIELGCLCEEQYRRDQSGRCIRKKDCPKEKKICNDGEIGRLGIQSSDSCNYQHNANDPLVYDCFCNDTSRRNQNGICVLKEKCTSHKVKCNKNEEFRCSFGCELTCYNVYMKCEKNSTCEYGCYCIKGYARNPEGVCITKEECTLITTLKPLFYTTLSSTPPTTTPTTPIFKCDGEHEEYKCGYGCNETCSNAGKNCTAKDDCVPGCYCIDGYVRDDDGKCLLKSECPEEDVKMLMPPLNEQTLSSADTSKPSKPTTTTQEPLTTILKTIITTKTPYSNTFELSDSSSCESSEDCEGETILPYISKRKKKLTTVKMKTMVKPTTSKSILSSTSVESKSDETKSELVGRIGSPDSEERSCSKSCEAGTIEAYQHASTFDSDESSKSRSKLTPHVHDSHDRMSLQKKKECEGKDCSNNEDHSHDEDCGSDDCEMQVSYSDISDLDQNIKDNKSNNSSGVEKSAHEESGEDHSCENGDCLEKTVIPIIETASDDVEEDDDDRCLNCKPKLTIIPKATEKAKGPTCRNKNEEYTCKNGCEVTCGSYDKPCRTTSKTCKEGCFCKQGFARNFEGMCIPIDQCNATETQTCSDPKEEYKCSYGCEPTCSLDRSECVKLPKCKFCCVCISGYVRGSNGKCILSQDCAKERCSKEYEEYRCSYGCEAECSTIGKLCHSKRTCRYGCFCIEGYARNSDKLCIPIENCKHSSDDCLGKNEESKQVCEKDGKCKNVCVCKEGYGRGLNGKCTPIINLCTKVHEEYRCSYGCEPACPIINTTCVQHKTCTNEGCYCLKGYLRNSKGICIPEKDCKETTCKGRHEETKLVCDKNCKKDEKCVCKHQCVCKKGFKRNSSGICNVNCKGPNEEFKCGYGCDAQCTNNECKPNKTCTDGCYCKANYARSANNTCIPKDTCETKCSEPNQEMKFVCEDCPPNDKKCKRCKNICTCINGYIKMPNGSCVLTDLNNNDKCVKPHEEHTFNFGCELTCTPHGIECIVGKKFGFTCVCVLNYIRDQKGNCIHLKECNGGLETLKCSKPFERFKCSYGCEPTYPASTAVCKKREECKNGCYCDEGYARNSTGDCVLIKDYPSKMSCKSHEEIKCSYGCEPTCFSSEETTLCVKNKTCKNECHCVKGYVRDVKGNCVLVKDCPRPILKKCLKPHEQYKCSFGCEPTCPATNTACEKRDDCKDGCYCVEGYARNSTGDCVLIKDCLTKNVCKPNQEIKCSYGCEPTCSSSKTTLCVKNKTCKNECHCIEGYVRDVKGTCIQIKDCPSTSTPVPKNCHKPHEQFKCSFGCEPTYPAINITCEKRKECKNGCYCVEGYARNSTGDCVSLKDCPSKNSCKPHEEMKCSYGCEPTCSSIEETTLCVKNKTCKNECHCVEGYVRDVKGNCVLINDCPITTTRTISKYCIKPHEQFKCSFGCEPTCPVINIACEKRKECKNGCYCAEGYARNSTGDCVLITDCPSKISCKSHEEIKCSYGCEPTCSSSATTLCLKNKTCKNECHCVEGYVRDVKGNCVLIKDCPSTTTTPISKNCHRPHEQFKCSFGCEPTCPAVNTACVKRKECKDGCYCAEGYARNSTGDCVLIKDCSSKKSCKLHEEIKCSYGCEPTCSTKFCVKNKTCKDECHCVEGYVRDYKGNCVRIKDCPSTTTTTTPITKNCLKPHEQYKCSFGCEPTCPAINTACEKRKECKDGCYCAEGYARNSTGYCILIKDCLSKKSCKPHEEMKCSYGCEPTCSSFGTKLCVKNETCINDCHCVEGYVRDYKGNCVRIKDCPSITTTPIPKNCYKPNEKYKCSFGCEPTCSALNTACEKRKECKDGCYCVEGYARNSTGDCVLIKDCPSKKSCKPHEEIKCSYGCEPTCSSIETKLCAKNKTCIYDCHCVEGYVRDYTGNCVRIKDCPSITTTPTPNKCYKRHEQYKCSFGCEPTCPAATTACKKCDKCTNGCFCKSGYVRDSKGNCIKARDCVEEITNTTPSTTTTTAISTTEKVRCPKSNEEFRCSYGCEATCDNYESVCFKKNTKCIPGCYCRHGYARDSKGACILLGDCKSSKMIATTDAPSVVPDLELNCTRPNEHYECGSACQTTCENYYKPCPIVNVVCNKGCYCNKGYARDSTKTCVPIKECSNRQNEKCGDNEEYRLDTFVYNECITPHVYSITKHYGCYCIKGYKRDAHGKCIPAKDCPSNNGIICTGEYEHYECGSACQITCKHYNKTCPITKIHCIRGCYCNLGYARNDKGVCIPVEHCNETSVDHCPNHEEYKFESPTKYRCVQDFTRKNFKRVLACHCVDGYKRDCAGHCVPQEDCPVSCKICGENEEYRYDIDKSPTSKRRRFKVLKCHCIRGFRYDKTGKCVYDTGEVCKTNEVFSYDNYNNNACTADFTKQENSLNVYACHCKDGYKRNKSGQCIKEHQCPEEIFANCTRPNEHYECGSPCQKTCGNYMKPCRIKSKGCIKGCYCKKGHARDCTGTCIAIQDCTLRENGICGDNEEYRLDTFVNNECTSNVTSSMIHPPLMHGCYCKNGYKRNRKGVCIPDYNC